MILGESAFERLPGYIRLGDDGTTADVMNAVASPVEFVVDWLSEDGGQVDPTEVTFDRLPWVAQMAGVDLSNVPDGEKREFVANPITRYRGNLAALRKRVGATLTGAKSIEITLNYQSDANRIAVTTYASQTPDAAKTEAAIRAEIPAWLRATITTNAAGQSYANMASDYATYGDMTGTNKSYGTLAQET